MESRQRLPALTSVRFFAAAAIVFFHLQGRWGLPSARETGLAFGIGVDLFFVLSGFILAYTYREVKGAGQVLKIIAYRIARIWPLHILLLALFFALFYDPGNPFHDASKIWASVLLVQAWFGDYTYGFNGNAVAWTLSVELFFYLAFPLLTMMSTRMIIVATMLVTLATLGWASLMPISAKLTDPVTSAPAIVRMHPGSFLVLFTAGMLAARLFLARDWQLDRAKATALEVAGLTLALVYFLYHLQIEEWLVHAIGAKGVTAIWLRNLGGAIFFAPLIFALAFQHGWLARVLSVRPLVILGDVSFAIYLLHYVVQAKMLQMGYGTPAYVALYLAIVLVGSIVLFRLVEKPSNRFLRARIDEASVRFAGIPKVS